MYIYGVIERCGEVYKEAESLFFCSQCISVCCLGDIFIGLDSAGTKVPLTHCGYATGTDLFSVEYCFGGPLPFADEVCHE